MRDELIALAERVEAFDNDVHNGEALGAEVINAATDGGLPFWEHANPLYSLDAAMGLVPDRHVFQCNNMGQRGAWARVHRAFDGDTFDAEAATPALALTAAALRARAEGVA